MDRAAYPADAFYTPVDYVGAFGRGNWALGWTALDASGYFAKPNADVEARPTVTVTDASINAGETVRWTADNVYVLSGLVIVEDGAELHIDAGTVVKAEDGQSTNASALVVARGGKIFAEGTASSPVIFTSVQDNISSADLLTYEDRGLWGGIVLLGRARTNNAGDSAGNYKEIEGVNELVADGDTRAEYGGDDDSDSSGIMRYVSIRHTGINIGESDGNEIQGLTLGGVGSGTVLEYIESYSSGDDGVEFFGGTVNLKYFVSAFNSDDAIDWDQGWRGKGQFWFALQGTDKAGAAAEQDGAGGDENTEPFAKPTIFNATYVGGGVSNTPDGDRGEMLMFRDNTGGFYHNSIFTDYNSTSGGHALTIEDIDNTGSKPLDSRQRFEAGDLGLTHNLWFGFGAGNSPSQFVNPGLANQQAIIDYLVANGNVVEDPALAGIERSTSPSGGLDPRPTGNSPAFTMDRAAYPADAFYTPVDYVGAFGRANWLAGWTALDANGYLGNIATGQTVDVEDGFAQLPQQVELAQNFPNPFNPTTTISFRLQQTTDVRLSVHDVLGREIAVLVDGVQAAGTFQASFDASNLASGMYIYRLQTAAGTISKTMTLLK
ncbi:MAG: T9SS type A sorting domain-containing protein [Bacteroidetes bacterium]|nr:T9SS type A sorting domain-containing protein [Bacteroidota bacterium]